MKAIQYIKLFNYLRDVEELEGMQIYRTINRVRKLPKEFLLEVEKILEGNTPTIEIEGVSFESLTSPEGEGMKSIRAILFLHWLKEEPDAALAYMAENNYMRAPIAPLNTNEQNELNAAIVRLQQQVKDPQQIKEPIIEQSKDDIQIHGGEADGNKQ